MAKLARAATDHEELIALADRGYYEGYEILECEQAGVAAVVPRPMSLNYAAAGLFDKRDFVYDDKADEYRCPAGSVYGETRLAFRLGCSNRSPGDRKRRSPRNRVIGWPDPYAGMWRSS